MLRKLVETIVELPVRVPVEVARGVGDGLSSIGRLLEDLVDGEEDDD